MATAQISLKWQDVEGKEITEVLYFDTGDVPTVAAAQTQMLAYETLLEALSGCKITEANVTFPLTPSATENADSGYSVRAGAWLSFRNSDGVGDGIYIPGILGDKIINDIVDSADSDVAAFIAAATGSGAASEEPLSTRGSASLWTTYIRGKGTSRKVK